MSNPAEGLSAVHHVDDGPVDDHDGGPDHHDDSSDHEEGHTVSRRARPAATVTTVTAAAVS